MVKAEMSVRGEEKVDGSRVGIGTTFWRSRVGPARAWWRTQGRAVWRWAKKGDQAEEVGPTEDLMREHGVINRVLLVYENLIGRIEQKQDFKPEVVTGAAGIIRNFAI